MSITILWMRRVLEARPHYSTPSGTSTAANGPRLNDEGCEEKNGNRGNIPARKFTSIEEKISPFYT
jgi:hypothetical protein